MKNHSISGTSQFEIYVYMAEQVTIKVKVQLVTSSCKRKLHLLHVRVTNSYFHDYQLGIIRSLLQW